MNGNQNLMDSLGIEVLEVGLEKVIAKMPVDHRTIQPFGILHGGATAALAETVGSIGAFQHVRELNGVPVGLELSINHLKSMRAGYVWAEASPLHLGKSTHLWEIHCWNEEKERIAYAKLTVLIKYEK
ncbi:MAG: PaaI family thioesterase [Bacteroidetes bacterium]|nr:PaaI family thioesterase [Bacteroidota bacterium]